MNDSQGKLAENQILAALPTEEYERIAPHFHPVELRRDQLLYQADQTIEHVYFPTDAMVSLVSRMSEGASVEVGVVGFEGMAGLPVLLGVGRSPHEVMTQIPGHGVRVGAQVIKDEFRRGGRLQELLLRYTQSLLLTTSQVAACNRAHSLGERFARWLLMSYDRCVCADLPLTQEFIAMMLGVRRAGVTEAAVILQTEGLIKYRRGHILIEDKSGLESFACECYGIIKAEFNRLPA